MRSLPLTLLGLGLLPVAHGAFYLPGIAPEDFAGGDEVSVAVNKLNSVKTQLPFDYYRFNFCAPETVQNKNENLGEVLAGEKIESSPYEFFMGKNEYCKVGNGQADALLLFVVVVAAVVVIVVLFLLPAHCVFSQIVFGKLTLPSSVCPPVCMRMWSSAKDSLPN